VSDGTTNNYGPVANMNGGQGNIGFNFGTAYGAASDPELRAAVEELTRRLRGLHQHLTEDQARTVDEALPELVPDRGVLRERGLMLASLAQIAAAVGTVGRPLAEAVGRLIELVR